MQARPYPRHRAAVYQAGMWQLPPAGSVDADAVDEDGTVDVRRQLLAELREELGLLPEAVGAPQPLCIVEHPGSHVSDFGLGLITGCAEQRCWRRIGTRGIRNMNKCVCCRRPN